MATFAAFSLRDYGGYANPTSLTAQLGPTDVSFTILNALTWVNLSGSSLGSSGAGPFVVAVDYGSTSEEKILCSAINTSTGVVTVWTSGANNGRGYDGTTAGTHQVGAIAVPVFSATEADEANSTAVNTVGQITTAGDMLYGTGANALTRLAVGAQGSILTSTGTAPGWTAKGSQGSIAYAGSTGIAFTAAGTSGQLLTSAGTGTPVWATNTNVANVAKATLATTGLNISTASTPSSQAFDGVTNAANINWTSNFATSGAYTVRNGTASVHGGIVVTNAGYYQITGTIGCAIVTGTTAGVMTVSIAVDGTATGAITKFWNSDATTGSNIAVQVTDILSLTAGQVINLAACEPTANLTTNGNTVITIHQVA